MNTEKAIPVVVCERDVPSMRQLVSSLPDLGREFDSHLARNPRELQGLLKEVEPLLVLSSQSCPELVIQEVYSQVSQHAPHAKIIAIATEMRPGVLTEAVKNGARDVITRDNLGQLAVVVARELDMLDEYRIHLQNPSAREADEIDPNHVYLDDGIVVGCGPAIAKLIAANHIDDVIGTLILDYCDAAYLSDIRERLKEWARGQSVDQPLDIPGITTEGQRLPLHVELVAVDKTNLGQMVLAITPGEKSEQPSAASPSKTTEAAESKPEKQAAEKPSETGKPAARPRTTRTVLTPEDNPWIRKLTHALEHDEFALASQRITRLTTDNEPETAPEDGTEHIDILIRMFLRLKDEGKEINANTFMGTARKAGLVPEIDRWVVGHACNLLAQHYGQDRHPLFFLRVSIESLAGNELIPWVEEKLKESRAPSGSLSFELPETEIIENLDDALPALKKLQDLGCHLTTSHFGSTSKTDMLLDSLPIHYVKLHPNDVKSLADNEHAVERVARMTERVKQRKVATIAPQVERAAQLAALWQCGVDYAQGYYMKQPEIVLTSAYRHRD